MVYSSFTRILFEALCLVSVVTQAHAQYPDPNDDPFYRVPDDINQYAKGQVIDSREIETNYTTNATYQYSYRTSDAFGNPTSTVGTVWAPLSPQSPAKIVLYSIAEDSIQLDCAPSWSWVNSSSAFYASGQDFDAPILLQFALAQGFYVVNTDAEGPRSALLSGLTEGQSALDGVKAAINLLSIDMCTAQTALIGYSGGAHTSVWAATLAEFYAPELNLVGASMGGTPVDLMAAYNILDNTTQSALAAGLLFGLGNTYPRLNKTMTSLLNTQGLQVSSDIRARNYCIPGNIDNTIVPTSLESLFKEPPMTVPQIVHAINRESLLMNVTTRRHIPVDTPPYRPPYNRLANSVIVGP